MLATSPATTVPVPPVTTHVRVADGWVTTVTLYDCPAISFIAKMNGPSDDAVIMSPPSFASTTLPPHGRQARDRAADRKGTDGAIARGGGVVAGRCVVTTREGLRLRPSPGAARHCERQNDDGQREEREAMSFPHGRRIPRDGHSGWRPASYSTTSPGQTV